MNKRKTEEEKKQQEVKLVPITIRFSEDAYNSIGTVASLNHMSKAEIVRLAVDRRLIEFLSTVYWADEEQGEAIRKELYNIGTALSNIEREINKIGVNYNQEIKLKHIQQKYAGKTDVYMLKRKIKEEDEVKAGTKDFSKDEFKKVMEDFAKISNSISRKLSGLRQ